MTTNVMNPNNEVTARSPKLIRRGDGQFGNDWSYIIDDHKIELCFEDNFFRPVRDNFLPGDTVRLIEMVNGRVTALCDIIILSKTADDIESGLVSGTLVRYTEKQKKADKLPKDVYDGPEYIKGDGKVDYIMNQNLYCISVKGHIVAKVRDEDEANAIARGDMPLPVGV